MIKKLFNRSKQQENKPQGYFQLATSWSDDYYARVIVSRNRYQIAFIVAMALCGLLTITTMMLVHTHEYIPLLVHHYESGSVTVVPANTHAAPKEQAEIESDLVRYIINRESYDPASFTEAYELVNLLSDAPVAKIYQGQQNVNDTQSYIQQFSNKVVRSVKVVDVSFLDNENLNETDIKNHAHKNLAEVHFIVTDKVISSGKETKTPYVAIVSWEYGGIPSDPELRWMNWNGFLVTSYQRNQRSI